MESFIGCDPGATGAICVYVPEINVIEFIPNKTNPKKILEMLGNLQRAHPIEMIMIEDVHSVPQSSAKANFTFGYNVGLMEAIFISTGMGLDKVQPKEWQKFIGVKPAPRKAKDAPPVKPGVRKTALKKEVAAIALRLYPDAELYGPKGGLLDGRSDALMICHFNYLKYK